MNRKALSIMLSGLTMTGIAMTVPVSAEEDPVHIRVALFSDGADMTDSQKQVFEKKTRTLYPSLSISRVILMDLTGTAT